MQSNTENISPQFAKLPPILGASRRMVCRTSVLSRQVRNILRSEFSTDYKSPTDSYRLPDELSAALLLAARAAHSRPVRLRSCNPWESSSVHGTCANSLHPGHPCQRRHLYRPGFCLDKALCHAPLAAGVAAACLHTVSCLIIYSVGDSTWKERS